jgi:hypothetical protein
MLVRDLIIKLIINGIDAIVENIWTDTNNKLNDEYNIKLYTIKYPDDTQCIMFLKTTSEYIVFSEMMQRLTDALDKSNAYGEEPTEEKINEIKLNNFDLFNEIFEQIHLLKNICTIIWIVFIVENNICNALVKCIDDKKSDDKLIF